MIHVAYRLWGGEGFYAKMLGTSMLSIFENTKEKVNIHIMHNDRLTADNRGKLCYIAGQYGQKIDFHNVDNIAGVALKKFDEILHMEVNAAWYPCIVHEIFSDFSKIIFLGADTVFNLDINELWSYDLNSDSEDGYGFAAVPEILSGVPKFQELTANDTVRHEDYFNSDILVINPSFFRKNFELILEGCRFIHNNGYTLHEQNVLNYLFSKKYKKLPGKFNLILDWERRVGARPLHLREAIYHFAGNASTKPSLDTSDIYHRLYLENFLKTPWANVDMFGNIHRALDKILREVSNEQTNILLHLTNLLAYRQRVFFIEKNNIEAIKTIFKIKKDNELIIDASELNSTKNLINALNKYKNQKIFFIISSNYPQIRSLLINNNFVEGIDFIDGFMLLSEQYGLKKNFDHYSRMLLQEM